MATLQPGSYSLIVTKAYGRDGPSARFETYAVPTGLVASTLEQIATRFLSGRELTHPEKLELQQQDKHVNPNSTMFDRMPVQVERSYDNINETEAVRLSFEICMLNLNAKGLGSRNSYLRNPDTVLADLDKLAGQEAFRAAK